MTDREYMLAAELGREMTLTREFLRRRQMQRLPALPGAAGVVGVTAVGGGDGMWSRGADGYNRNGVGIMQERTLQSPHVVYQRQPAYLDITNGMGHQQQHMSAALPYQMYAPSPQYVYVQSNSQLQSLPMSYNVHSNFMHQPQYVQPQPQPQPQPQLHVRPRIYNAQPQDVVGKAEFPGSVPGRDDGNGVGRVQNRISFTRSEFSEHAGNHNMTELLAAVDRGKSPQLVMRRKRKSNLDREHSALEPPETPSPTKVSTATKSRPSSRLRELEIHKGAYRNSHYRIGIDKLAPTVRIALNEFWRRNGSSECSFEELCKDICTLMRVQYYEATSAIVEDIQFCLLIMMGLGFIRRESRDKVVVVKT